MNAEKRAVLLVSLLWMFCSMLTVPVCHSAPGCISTAAGDCDTSTTASFSSDTNQSYLHRIVNQQAETSAVDVCVIVSAAMTMRSHQRWLQIAVPQLEQQLISMGIGNETDKENRYCLVQFGGRGVHLRGHFLLVNGEKFFPSSSFVAARRQLKRSGDIADGYEAVEFTLNNAPFRNDTDVKKILFLVSNMGRSVLAIRANLTKNVLLAKLFQHQVILDTIVSAEFGVITQDGPFVGTVIGVNGPNTSTVVRPDGEFEFVKGEVTHTSSEGQTVADYVTLSLAAGSSSWSINILSEEVSDEITSFVKSFVATHGLDRVKTVEVCQQCLCKDSGSDDGGGGSLTSCASLECEVHSNQELCRCLVTGAPSECGVIDPTPVIPDTTTVPNISPTETLAPLVIRGNISQYPGGEVEVTFDSERSKANYQCVLVADGGTESPPVVPCESPYYLKNLSSGQYELIVIGKRKESLGSLLFKFTVENDDDTCQPEIHLSAVQSSNNMVTVTFREDCFNVQSRQEEVNFHCSLAGREFASCSSPYTVNSSDIASDGVNFIVVAKDWRDRLFAKVLHITPPTPPPPPGPVMIGDVRVDPPDPFGRVVFSFNTTDPAALCSCRVNQTILPCPGRFSADPRELGEGVLNITISCFDSMGYIDAKNLKLSLLMPPAPPSGPLSCELTLRGPNEAGILMATYTCDRIVIATCQIATMEPRSCNLPASGQYEVDVTSLEPGPHLFIITLDDGYGKSVMKIYPFFIGTAHRKCCPIIANNSTLVQTPGAPSSANLSLSVQAGNCSTSEGFKYMVDWGDGAREAGMSTDLSDIYTSRVYASSTGNYTVEVTYCNNPVTEQNICCDSITLPLNS